LRGEIFGEVDFLGTSQWEEREFSCGGEFFERRSSVGGREFFLELKWEIFWKGEGYFEKVRCSFQTDILLPRYKSQRRYRKKRERESCFKYE